MPAVRLEPMTWDDYDAWLPRSVAGFAAQQVASGLHGEPAATAYAHGELAMLLPDGLATLDQHFWTVRVADDADDAVGWAWMRVGPGPEGLQAYLYDIEVETSARGRGIGRAAMLALEDVAHDLGAVVLRLNVFGHNTAAIALYDGLGYAVEQTHSARPGEVTAQLRAKLLPGR